MLKFGANNFITPRHDLEPRTTGRLATASIANDGSNSGKTGPTQSQQDIVSLKILEHPKEPEDTVVIADDSEADGDNTMKSYVDDLLGNNRFVGGRSSMRVNSLLYEEDSLQIKREMVRQK